MQAQDTVFIQNHRVVNASGMEKHHFAFLLLAVQHARQL